ncbi:MAG: hypothetical protein P8N23_01180 [Methylophilaceae bacterium]|nr:hypothetical protein [Methylophilaceae bacterium]
MVQNRKAPAYQEYAATMLANKNYRLMSLSERGLLFAMRLECWENKDIPAKTEELAKYLGFQESELNKAFTERVKTFFNIESDKLTSPELDDYRQHLDARKSKQSDGGKKGSSKTNAKFKDASTSQVTRQGSRESLVKYSSDKFSKTQSLENGDISMNVNDEWIKSYDKESNGN